MKVAAYQAPLLKSGSMEALPLIQSRIRQCEAEGIAILCCPEAILGGLADNSRDPMSVAIATARIPSVVGPLTSDTVTTIVGLTELADDGALYNSAAVVHRGTIAGVYRKQHPAIRRSVYAAGTDSRVFNVDGLTFGIVICYDTNFPECVARVAQQGANALFVPSNNALPRSWNSEDIVTETRHCDAARALETKMWVIRADVAGRAGELASAGSSEVVRPDGSVLLAARKFSDDLLIADLSPS
jgi:predicted amidohydrolase